MPLHTVYLATGTNLGDRWENLQTANHLIKQSIGDIFLQSNCYQTAAWGNKEQDDFYNQVLAVRTSLPPEEILTHIQSIETHMGRVRKEYWGPRVIDIDILLYDDLCLETDQLTIPHPFLPERNFVLIPLMEIAGDVVHPILNLSIEALYLQCRDQEEVIQLELV